MQTYIVQEHLKDSDGIDYFKLFHNKETALNYYLKKVNFHINYLNFDLYEELFNDENKVFDINEFQKSYSQNPAYYTVLADGDYISFMEVSDDGTARSRP